MLGNRKWAIAALLYHGAVKFAGFWGSHLGVTNTHIESQFQAGCKINTKGQLKRMRSPSRPNHHAISSLRVCAVCSHRVLALRLPRFMPCLCRFVALHLRVAPWCHVLPRIGLSRALALCFRVAS